jgi:copper chaperone CopZ
MPDVAFIVTDISDTEGATKLERALTRLDGVKLANVDSEKGLVAVSYDEGGVGRDRIEAAIREAGHEVEPSPGADPDVD